MKKICLFGAVGALAASCAFGAWGQLIRSFYVRPAYATGIAVMPDGYLFVSRAGFQQWYCYTTRGSLVRSYTGVGFYDGAGRCHLPGYFVVTRGSGGVWRFGYTGAGGLGPGARMPIPATGRGISWDGVYYYVTTGSWGTPVGMYTTNGSLVGTVTGPWAGSLYGHAHSRRGTGYLLCATTSPSYVYEVAVSTGSATRWFAVPSTPAGADTSSADVYIYVVIPGAMSHVNVYDTDGMPVAPASLGRVKALFR
ncbi:MAG: hypothetical protein JSU81_05810 [Candidatus Coatesbacteria bacterium]|nr:MAG: hypothetical protein JSU81_05810 [Candidatus Coatesbacteria bacterium]